MAQVIKYTTDGKKVVVIGNLNAQEKIVQEVFISGDSEIPSGENFVVRSLHDAPVVSWKEAEVKRIEEYYESQKAFFGKELSRLKKGYESQRDELQARIEYSAKVIKHVSPESFDLLKKHLMNEIKWVVVMEWKEPVLIEYKDLPKMYERRLKLLSIFGADNGALDYRLHEYYDSSGSNKTIHAFDCYEDAFGFFKDAVIGKEKYNNDSFVTAKKYNIILDAKKVEAYKLDAIEGMRKAIAQNTEQISRYNTTLDELEKL